MKRYLCTVFFSVLILQTSAFSGEKIRYAVFPAPPYMIGADREGKDVSGIDVDIAREIASRMNLELEFIRCPWARCLAMMQSGEADLLSSVWKRPEREAYLRFFDAPFLDQLPITFFSRKARDGS